MSDKLTIEKFVFQYLDQNPRVEHILFNKKLLSVNDSCYLRRTELCESFESTNHFNINLTYSSPQRISVITLKFEVDFVQNATINDLDINLSISRYRNCVVDERTEFSLERHFWIFICEFKSLEDYKDEKIIHQSIDFSFKSEKTFQLAICMINVYQFLDGCGTPDIPLPASYNRLDDESFEYFLTPQKIKHRMIGDSVITCVYDGNWDKEPPIFEPIIKCHTDEIEMNSGIYKSIKRENFEFFNKTQVAVIDSKILFECNNEENSSNIQVSICYENGLWIGDDLKCKFEGNIHKRFYLICFIFQAKRIEIYYFQ